jgi:hypothetical protein
MYIAGLDVNSLTHKSTTRSSPRTSSTFNSSKKSSPELPIKKQSLIFFGIPESSTGTLHSERLENDYNAVIQAIEPLVDNTHIHSAIGLCTRLGMYNRSSNGPRPL